MKNPIVRLLFITISAIIVVFLVLFTLRIVGYGQQHRPLEMSFLKAPVVIYKGGQSSIAPSNSLLALKKSIELGGINMIHLQRTRDGHFVLFEPKTLQEQTDGQGPVFLKSLKELKRLDGAFNFNLQGQTPYRKKNFQILSLVDYLEVFNKQPVVINMLEQDPARMHGLDSLLKKYNMAELVILHSPYTQTLRYLRKEMPRTLSTINQQMLMKALFFESLYIETLVPLKGDLVLSPPSIFNQPLFTPRVLAELKRRHLSLILDLTEATESDPSLKDVSLGVIQR